jgi:hypothetical protein
MHAGGDQGLTKMRTKIVENTNKCNHFGPATCGPVDKSKEYASFFQQSRIR